MIYCIATMRVGFVCALKPKLSGFLLDLHKFLAHQGLAKSLDISIGMPNAFRPAQAGLHQYPGTFLRKKSLNLG